MNIGVYTQIRERLLDYCKELTDVRLFNSQIKEIDKERPLVPPLALLQFKELALTNMTYGVQKLELTLSVHILLSTLTYEDEQIIEITTKVGKALHCWAMDKGSPFQRTSVFLDEAATNLFVHRIDFECAYMDDSLYNGPVVGQVPDSAAVLVEC